MHFPSVRCVHAIFALLTLHVGTAVADDRIFVSKERVRLGDATAPEWEWFENDRATATRGEFHFAGRSNATEATLFIRQADVKQEWRVALNGRPLGKLFLMEESVVHSLAIPPGAIREGDNVLSINPLPGSADDIILRDIEIALSPVAESTRQADLQVEVRDESGALLPSRITIVDSEDALCPLVALPGQNLAVRPGVVYTGSGRAALGLRAGKYTVHASRGFEYGVDSQNLQIEPGRSAELKFRLKREVPTQGLAGCDPHIHTLTLSGHGDSTLDERMLTIAGEGIELPVATEHNQHADYEAAAERSGTRRCFTPVRGNEVTTSRGHFNVFPISQGSPVPNARLTAWPDIFQAIRAIPSARVIVLNHPRSIHNQFRPFDPVNYNTESGENPAGLDLSFEAMELLNSGAQQSDYTLVLRDWFALLNRGHRITAVGASDSHDVSRFIVGQARTLIAADDTDPSRINVDAACENLRAGKAIVCMGLLPSIEVEERFGVGDLATSLPKEVRVRVKVLGPSWVTVSRVDLFANGVVIQSAEIAPDNGRAAGVKADIAWTIPKPAKDTHLVVVATGPAVTAPYWAMSRPYQPATRKWEGRSIGVTNPVWLDADGDGRFTAVNAALKAP